MSKAALYSMKVTTACLSSRRTLSMNHIKAHTLSLHPRAGLNPAWVSGSRSSSTAISRCATTAKSSLYEWQRKQSLYYGPFLHRECFFRQMYGYITWCGIQSFGPLKVLHTSLPGRPVNSDTNSTSTLQLLREDYSLTFPQL